MQARRGLAMLELETGRSAVAAGLRSEGMQPWIGSRRAPLDRLSLRCAGPSGTIQTREQCGLLDRVTGKLGGRAAVRRGPRRASTRRTEAWPPRRSSWGATDSIPTGRNRSILHPVRRRRRRATAPAAGKLPAAPIIDGCDSGDRMAPTSPCCCLVPACGRSEPQRRLTTGDSSTSPTARPGSSATTKFQQVLDSSALGHLDHDTGAAPLIDFYHAAKQLLLDFGPSTASAGVRRIRTRWLNAHAGAAQASTTWTR